MEQYVDGDVVAYEKLYGLIKSPIRSGLRRWLKLNDQVEDAFQVTLLKLHANRERYRKNAPVIPWVLTIARNVALDQVRSKGHKVKLLEPQSVAEIRDAQISPQDWNADEQKELIQAVRAAVDELPETYREVVRLHKLEDRTMDEIAEILEIKKGTVRVRAHRGYKELAKRLTSLWKGDD